MYLNISKIQAGADNFDTGRPYYVFLIFHITWMQILRTISPYSRRSHKSFLNTPIPCLLALGGDKMQHPHFAKLVKDPTKLTGLVRWFIENYISQYNFSGVHVDWRYPGARCGTSDDKRNLLLTLIAFKTVLGKRMLTMSMPNDPAVLRRGFDVPAMFDMVDYVIVSSAPEPPRLVRDTVHCRNNQTQARRIIRQFQRQLSSTLWPKVCEK